MRQDSRNRGGRKGRPNRARLAAFGMVFLLGAALSVAQCMPPPKGVPRRDAGALQEKASAAPTPSTTESLPTDRVDKRALSRLKPLKGVKRVHLVDLTGTVDEKRAAELIKAIAKIPAADAVVLELDSTGGANPNASLPGLSSMSSKAFVIAYVRGNATGMASLIPLSSRLVVMAPQARYGAMGESQFEAVQLPEAATLVYSKAVAKMAKARNRPVAWAKAMVVKPGAPAAGQPVDSTGPPPGKLVSLSALQALKTGMADVIARDLQSLVRQLGLDKAQLLRGGKAVKSLTSATPPLKRRNIDPKKIVAGTRRIVVIDIKGMVELGMLAFVQRAIGRTKSTDLVIIDVDTLGGRVDAAIRIRDALLRAKGKTLAFVNPRAISAGALISLSCDLIIMAPGGSMGAATPITTSGGKASPVGEKYVSYMRKEMKATAEAKGRRGDLAEAMVDMSIDVKNVSPELKESISGLKKGKLLTLTTEEALKLDMVEGKASSFEDLLSQLGLKGVPVERPKENWAEKLARFLINPALAGVLMLLGILGIFIEMRTPGFGVAGTLGIICIAIVLFGHKIAGLGGWEPLLLFLLGVALLAVEIFITPGFGLLGGAGILAILGALVWALIGAGGIPLSISWDQGYITSALVRVFGVILISAVIGVLLVWLLPKAPGPLGRLVLSATVSGDATAQAHDLPESMDDKQDLVGCTGTTETALRPTGKAKIEGKRLEVESRGGFIDKGAQVKVVEAVGRRIVVKEVSE